MSTADIIIVVLVVLAVGAIIAFTCFRKKKSPCSHCPYKKDCDNHCTTGNVKKKSKKSEQSEELEVELTQDNISDEGDTDTIDNSKQQDVK